MHKFLLIDRDHDGLFYYGRTLLRKFPTAVLVECNTAEQAVRLVLDPDLTAVVCHCAVGVKAEDLIPLLRKQRPELPIVWVSSGEPKKTAEEIGATRFINYDEWLMIGTLLSQIIETSQNA